MAAAPAFSAIAAATIEIVVPSYRQGDLVEFIAEIERLAVKPEILTAGLIETNLVVAVAVGPNKAGAKGEADVAP